ncbi:hypothetical protein [Bacillus sp. T33-2]|uniref:hypothetical protein n=1 Tax=Bacillus sp. T33-2 TaxID=2054168 RepID=UPI000C78398F|nr:hypothetical protein [Bacillus sp. T33-2]PLR99570.1 hypothetical protein CVD19_00470 [Bacillus sp. T33-2]
MKLKNGKYSLKALQLAYLGVKLEKEQSGNQCLYCWSNGCGCSSHNSVKFDPFINLTEELKYA